MKLGVDPTTPDIHLGHTVVLRKLREFQDLGHQVVLIIGDYTARVGDPSGRSSIRPFADPAEIDRNAETYEEQAFKVLDRGATEVRRNGEWLDMPMEELFALARTSTVAQLLERDDFAQRYAAGEPISILELLYPLMQGYDSVAVRSDVELGATDQKFNVLLAREIQRAYGVDPQSILTMPILPGIDGVQKMSKSLGNYVGVDDPPEDIYGKLMRVPDEALQVYYSLLLDSPLDTALPPRDAKRAMARELTARLHGDRPRPRQRRSASTRCTCAASCPRRSRSSPSRPTASRRSTCPRSWPTPSASRAPRPAACSPRPRSGSTASRSTGRRSICPRSGSTAR